MEFEFEFEFELELELEFEFESGIVKFHFRQAHRHQALTTSD